MTGKQIYFLFDLSEKYLRFIIIRMPLFDHILSKTLEIITLLHAEELFTTTISIKAGHIYFYDLNQYQR